MYCMADLCFGQPFSEKPVILAGFCVVFIQLVLKYYFLLLSYSPTRGHHNNGEILGSEPIV